MAKVSKKGTVIIANQAAGPGNWARGPGVMKNGGQRQGAGACHRSGAGLQPEAHAFAGESLSPQGRGQRLCHRLLATSGYTSPATPKNTPEMKALKNIDVAFLPMNLPYTMTPEMVADAAKAFKPKVLYPYHFGQTDTNRLKELLKAEPGIEVRIRPFGPGEAQRLKEKSGAGPVCDSGPPALCFCGFTCFKAPGGGLFQCPVSCAAPLMGAGSPAAAGDEALGAENGSAP